jgi:hypothetical protein
LIGAFFNPSVFFHHCLFHHHLTFLHFPLQYTGNVIG